MKSYTNPAADHRKDNMDRIIRLATSTVIPDTWALTICEASVRFESKVKDKLVKIDSCCTMTLDVVYKGTVRSNTFACESVDKVWPMVTQALKAYTGIKS